MYDGVHTCRLYILRRYDTIKTFRWNFSWAVHYREICKHQVLKLGVTMLFSEFWMSKDQKYYRNWAYETVFVYILGFIFQVLLVQKLIYALNIWFNFMPGSFFKQDHLLNVLILRFYAKRWPRCTTYFKTETDVVQNLIDFFYNFDCKRILPLEGF